MLTGSGIKILEGDPSGNYAGRRIGEIILKNIDLTKRCCTPGIHMKNDSVKTKAMELLRRS